MSCHGYEGVMSVLCTPLQVKCFVYVMLYILISYLLNVSVTLYFTTRKQLCKYTEITVYISAIIVYFRLSTREQYVKFWVIKG